MITEERYSKILNLLYLKKSVTVAILVEMLNTSESTIRRDLNALNEMGRLIRVFGGAMLPNNTDLRAERSMSEKRALNYEGKEMIARYAASIISDDDFVFIDAGTTTEILAEVIRDTKAKFVTNAVAHAARLIQKGINVSVLGGALKSSTEAIIGAEALESLRRYNFTKCFLGVNGIGLESGLTTPDPEEASIKRECVQRSLVSYVLADHSKFDIVSSVNFASLDSVCVITDKRPRNEFMNRMTIKIIGEGGEN